MSAARLDSDRRTIRRTLMELIRPTQLLKLRAYPGVMLKCEHENPSGSHKDRAYAKMLSELEEVDTATILVDYSTGNGGISLAWLAQQLGMQAVVFMPDGMTKGRATLIEDMGAQLVVTPKDHFIRGAREAAEAFVAGHSDRVLLNQSDNLSNQRAYMQVGDEIIRQSLDMEAKLGAFVCGIGTGGTFSGVSLALKAHFRGLPCIAIEVCEAPVIWAKRNGKCVTPSIPAIIGFGPGAIALNTDERLIDDVEVISDVVVEPILERLREIDGLSVGPSTAANILVAAKRAAQLDRHVITVSFDRSDRYP